MDNPRLLFLFSCFGIFVTGGFAQSSYGGGSPAAYGGQGGYGGDASQGGSYSSPGGYGAGGSGYTYQRPGQGSGVYFKKPVPIDEKPVFFRTPYWLPNMYYGHYGYPWTEWFDGGPRFVVPIMNAYPHGGGGTQSYGAGAGGAAYGAGSPGGAASSGYSAGQSGSYTGGDATSTDATTTPDPYNDGFSYYKGVPIYQTYYEKYLLQKNLLTTAAPA